MSDCIVKSNCLQRFECDFCENFSYYQPEDKKILSPAQIERKENRKAAKKELKQSEASKRGKRNKRAGYRSECSMVKKYTKWGIQAERNPLSGALKGKYAGDIKVVINGKEYIQEDKKRQNFDRYYDLTADKAVFIEGFCVLLNEDDWYRLLNGMSVEGEVIPNNRFKQLHEFFSQDDADIVSMHAHGRKKSIFAISMKLWKELTGNGVD